MSSLVFNGGEHQIELYDDRGKFFGSWTAYNNVDSHATLTHLQNRSYSVIDRSAPHRHAGDHANGPYGSYGIIRFSVPDHPGIGLHSGRANSLHMPGPAHATMGCIRTTDEAMAEISRYIRTSPLTFIRVENNSAWHARHATRQHQYRTLHD